MPSPKFHAADATKNAVCCTTHYAGRRVRARGAFRRITVRIALALAAALFIAPAYGACLARSGPETAALVELYTSEGCSSCPPADRWLSGIATRYSPRQVVPLALHVDYWDYIGWKDPYAKREFSQRQRRLSQLQRAALVYTPQVLLQGADFRQWGNPEFDRAVSRINGQPARASLELEIVEARADAFTLRASAAVPGPVDRSDAAFYVAAYENRLESRITAGENSGRVLHHDHVVFEWRGPYTLGTRQLELALLPKAKTGDSGAVAFVQNRRTGEVLQALSLAACMPGGF
ncbi:MAG TPA: DUF1223 domain-containing protein [Burkholderiales bacterium]|nr:DUF1223 domain-containing protein [Burkholderiales bacterium]